MLAFKSLIVFGLPLIVAANPLAARNDPPTVCNSGSVQCCADSHKVDNTLSGLLGRLLDIEAIVDTLLGLDCSPITVVGLGGGTKCNQQTLCCTGNSENGGTGASSLIDFNCSPITISL